MQLARALSRARASICSRFPQKFHDRFSSGRFSSFIFVRVFFIHELSFEHYFVRTFLFCTFSVHVRFRLCTYFVSSMHFWSMLFTFVHCFRLFFHLCMFSCNIFRHVLFSSIHFFVHPILYHLHFHSSFLGKGKWSKTDQRGKTDHRLSGPNQRCYMLEYIIATFVLACPSRAGHMVRLAGMVSESFAKMLFFHKTILCERSEDRKV